MLKLLHTIHRIYGARLRNCNAASGKIGNVRGFSISPEKNVLQPVKVEGNQQFGVSDELTGLPLLKPANQLRAPETRISVLPNGLRIASEETYGQSSTISLFIDAGSRFEDGANNGISHLMEHLSFKTTKNRTHAELVREVEKMGGNVMASSGREQLVYTVDVLRDSTDKGMEILADTILNPALLDSELEGIKNILRYDQEHLADDPQQLIQQKIHEAAYGPDSPLGRSLQCPLIQIPRLNADTVRRYMGQFFAAPRMVLAGTGVEHEWFAELANKYFKDIIECTSEPVLTRKAEYKGGQLLMERQDLDLSYAALAFEAGGWHDEDLVPVCVLHTLLGGGDSFSAGGPGKGMYSRLYTSILNRYYWIESATAFTSIHSDAGLIGIYGASQPSHTSNLIAILCNQMLRIAGEPVDALELSRARNQLKSSVLMNLESRSILNEDIGRQILTYGKREPPESICMKIDAVTVEDIQRVGRRAIEKAPSIVFYGDLKHFPKYEDVCNAINTSKRQMA